MMKKLSVILLFLILTVGFLLLIPRFALAMEEPGTGYALDIELKKELEDHNTNLTKFTLNVFERMLFTTQIAIEGLPSEEGETHSYQRSGGALGMVTNLIAGLYVTQPASSVEYLADLGQNLDLVQPAYAQGMSWYAFSPVLKLWKTFRNIAYLAFVVIFVIIGFMIMFRAKINPQTVISVQNALPKIVVTLLLITFSYAIAGFVVDISQFSCYLIGNTFQKTDLIANPRPNTTETEQLNKLYNANIFQLLRPLSDTTELKNALKEIWMGETGVVPWSLRADLAWLGAITIQLILAITAFFLMFKIFFALLGPYVSIVISIIFAPFQLLLGIFKGDAFIGWLKGLISNLAVFPVTWTMLCLAAIFKSGPDLAKEPSNIGINTWFFGAADWSTKGEPLIINFRPIPGIGNWGKAVGHLIGFGILFITPKVAEIVRSSLEGKPLPVGAITGEQLKEVIKKVPFVGGLFSS